MKYQTSGEESRLEERRGLNPSLDSEVWVLKTKVDLLTDSLSDIKETLKRIVEIVSVISIIEVNAKQLSKETAALSVALSSAQDQIDILQKALIDAITLSDDKNAAKLKALTTELETLKSLWNERYNMARGMWLVISALSTVIVSVVYMYIHPYATRVDEMYTWIDHYKIEMRATNKTQDEDRAKIRELLDKYSAHPSGAGKSQ